ncbi:MAG: hypothetical protein HY294_09570 [Candidatus Rokubacteria bacterium]|nr:hypothetical protein [Candidatus Rokubacteria bacterium]
MALLVALAFTAGLAGAAAAQTTTTTTPPAEKKAMDKPAPAADKMGDKKMGEKKMMSTKSATGTVKSAAADSIVITGKDKGKDAEWTFAVDTNTKIRKGGKDVAAADLKAGDPVVVRFADHEGKMTAHMVNVRPAAMMKKADTTKKDEAAKKEEKK